MGRFVLWSGGSKAERTFCSMNLNHIDITEEDKAVRGLMKYNLFVMTLSFRQCVVGDAVYFMYQTSPECP